MLLPILSILIVLVFFPAYLIYTLLTGRRRDRLSWLLEVLMGAAFVLLVTLIGRWDWLSIYLRFVPLVLYAGAVVLSYRRVRELPFRAESGAQADWAGGALGTLLAAGMLGVSVSGWFVAREPVQLAFPFRGGAYYVAQGGSSFIVNYHRSHPEQAFAADITKLNAAGARAAGFRPAALERYAIFGEPVYSPCEGEVVSAEGSLPDLTPPERDPENPPGNHVAIACQGVTVVLAHLQQGSVTVEPGDTVTNGQMLGRIGNSGNTDEPHLHIHAFEGGVMGEELGAGVPVSFEGRMPVRNMVYRR